MRVCSATSIGSGLGGDAVQRVCGYVGRGDLPALLGEPDGVAALSCPDVEYAAGCQVAHLVHERPVGVAAPHRRVAPVAVVPVGLIARRTGACAHVVVGEAERDHGADAAAVRGGVEHL